MLKKGTLKNGFKFTIDDARLDDMELLEDLVAVDNGNVLVLPAVINKMLGETQKKRL